MLKLIRLLFFVVFLCCPFFQAGADAIIRNQAMLASTIAEFYVEDDQVLVKLEVGVKDLSAFKNLLPDEIYQKMEFAEKPLKERVVLFFEEDFPLLADAKPLKGYVKSMAPQERIKSDQISGEPLPVADKDKETVIAIELVFPFDKKPQQLALFTVQKAPANIGFVAYHKKIPVNDFRYLGNGYQLTLNWDDPWYSSFKSRNLRRQYYAPMSGLLYIEPFEVRKEIILRPKDLQYWVDLGLSGKETISVDMQAEIKQKVVEFLSGRLPVKINGKPVQGQIERINFLQRSLKRSIVIDNQVQDVNSATLGIIYSFPTQGLPQTVTMNWDVWNDQINEIPAAAVDQAGPLQTLLQPDWNVLEWQNFLKTPVIPSLLDIELPPEDYFRILVWTFAILALLIFIYLINIIRNKTTLSKQLLAAFISASLLLGSFYFHHQSSVDHQQVQKLVAGLLHNIYRAFDYRDEEKIYDTLNNSVVGELLTNIFLQTKRSLVLANQGGARAKVKSLELVSTDNLILQHDGFTVHTVWNVFGSVGHWGHVHQRTNQYEANLSFKPIDDQWKLTSMEVLQEQRL